MRCNDYLIGLYVIQTLTLPPSGTSLSKREDHRGMERFRVSSLGFRVSLPSPVPVPHFDFAQ